MAWTCMSKSAKTACARLREERVPPHAISLARAEPRFDAQKVDNLDLVHVSLRSPGKNQDEKNVNQERNECELGLEPIKGRLQAGTRGRGGRGYLDENVMSGWRDYAVLCKVVCVG